MSTEILLFLLEYVGAVLYALCIALSLVYFLIKYDGEGRFIFVIAILCPIWNLYFAYKVLHKYLNIDCSLSSDLKMTLSNLMHFIRNQFSFKD